MQRNIPGPAVRVHRMRWQEPRLLSLAMPRPGVLPRKLHAEALREEGPLVGGFFDDLGGRFAGAVASPGFDPDQDRGGAGLGGLHGGRVLEAVAGEDPVVVVCRDYQGRRIFRAWLYVMKRGIFVDRVELL